jgi:hypothetical protein
VRATLEGKNNGEEMWREIARYEGDPVVIDENPYDIAYRLGFKHARMIFVWHGTSVLSTVQITLFES